MNKYRYKAKNLKNQIIKGILLAEDIEDLREIINHQGYFLVTYHKIAESSQMFSFLERIQIDDFTAFCRQLSVMITSGMEITSAIRNLYENTHVRKLKSVLEDIERHVNEGESLSTSFAYFPKTFPPFFCSMISIGEASGNLDYVLNRLADYYEKEAKIKKKISSSMTYPKILLSFALGIIFLLSLFIMPMFTAMFMNFGSELPLITKIINSITTFIRVYFPFIVIAGILLYVSWIIFKKSKWGRYHVDYLKLKIPVYNSLTLSYITARFTNGFFVLIESGGKIIDSLELLGRLFNNKVVEEKFKIVTAEIKRGKPIAKSMETINLFPQMLIEMIKIGEESDSIEKVIEKTTTYFDSQIETTLAKLIALIEPLSTIMIGLVIIVVLLSIFIPMLGILDVINEI